MKIGEIATCAGVPAKTLRFWEENGLIREPNRTASGYRDYDPEVLDRVAFIRHAQQAGFALNQIRQILDIGDSGKRPCAHVTDLIAQRLADVDARISQLQQTREYLTVLAKRAAAQNPRACRGYCSIITG